MQRFSFLFSLIFCALVVYAQKTHDKAEADRQVFQELINEREMHHWHPDLIVKEDMLKETQERGVYCVEGTVFQVKSLRADYDLKYDSRKWLPIYDSRYPVESLVNLLLARIDNNLHLLELRHHQYGNHIANMKIPLQRFHDLFGPDMDMYCRVSIPNNDELNAWLVFYQSHNQYIHLLELTIPTKALFVTNGIFYGDLYTNIPQGNIKTFL